MAGQGAGGIAKVSLLNRALLRSGVAPGPGVSGGLLQDLPERILQFGEGNFLRAFADWMVDVLNEQGLRGGRIVVVQPIPEGTVAQLHAQDGLYTLISRGIEGGDGSSSPAASSPRSAGP